MTEKDKIYNYNELSEYTDKELLQVLRSAWGYKPNEPFYVIGRLKRIDAFPTSFYLLEQIHSSSDLKPKSYPLWSADVQQNVFVGPVSDKFANKEGMFAKGLVKLSPKKEREKRRNPFALQIAKNEELILLEKIPKEIIKTIEVDDENFIEKWVVNHYVKKNHEKLTAGYDSLKRKLEKEHIEIKKNIAEQYAKIKNAFEKEQNRYNKQIDELENDYKIKQTKHTKKIETLEKKLASLENKKQVFNTELKGFSQKKKSLNQKIAELKQQHADMEQTMAKNIERLKSYIEEKVIILKQLEFIDEQEFNNFFGNAKKESSGQDTISFKDDLQGDYSKAVSYIQAHLLEQNILYPRHVIENFFALIRSNDLIILAGDSGSGKTNLVQSFARAIGGVPKIIPVKPNWTSSEDLLGYYNPLEKKYLATPFLEALIEAKNNPDVPYLICLDEMNLARVEYYFADFLSKLEQRGNKLPEIQLYSDSESAHVLSELRNVIEIIDGAKTKYQKGNIVDFVKLLQDEEINAEIKRAFGFSEKESLLKYHSELRRMLSGTINTPASIVFPSNVRIIGAINIDETTHYLSPKILDRAHIMKFRSPLLTDWDRIQDEIQSYSLGDVKKKVFFEIEALGERDLYPDFKRENSFCLLFIEMNRDYFDPLGIEFGMRTIKQGLNYLEIFSDFNSSHETAVNNFILHKILPKLNFDGNKKVDGDEKSVLLRSFGQKLDEYINFSEINDQEFSAQKELERILKNAETNDGIVNFWS